MLNEPVQTLETRPDCVIETWTYNGGIAGYTIYSPGSTPDPDPEVEIPDGYLANITPVQDDTFEVDFNAGHAPPEGVYPTFEDALARVLRGYDG